MDTSIHKLEQMIIKNRWIFEQVIGKGAFGEVYEAYDTLLQCKVAIKVEPPHAKKQVLKLEMNILKKSKSCYMLEYIGGGKFVTPGNDMFTYLVMTKAEKNLSELRKSLGMFSVHTTALLGIQMVKAIQSVHELRILHRDIKPDFGLSRRFLNQDGGIRDQRSSVGFRGTARYASITAHLGKELGRVDDLWSLFYMTIEFLRGTLPWKGKEKDKIGELKIRFTNAQLVAGLPSQISQLYDYLSTLQYDSNPDYDFIARLYQAMLVQTGMDQHVPFDWEIDNTSCTMYDNFVKSPLVPEPEAVGPTKSSTMMPLKKLSVDSKIPFLSFPEAAEPTKSQTLVELDPQPPQDPIPSRLTRLRRRFKMAR